MVWSDQKIRRSSGWKILSPRFHYVKDWNSSWFCESRFLNFLLEPFADALLLAKQCWKTNMAQSHSSIWLILWGNCKKVCLIWLMIELITNTRCFQICLLAKFSPQNRNSEYEKKWHWNESDFKEPRSFELSGTFCRRKHLCLTVYLVSGNKIILD